MNYREFAEEKINEWLCDDATYPCYWFEKVAEVGRDVLKQKALIAEFADHVSKSDYWTDILEEATELGEDFSREIIAEIAEAAMRYDISTWCELTDEEQKQYFDFDE